MLYVDVAINPPSPQVLLEPGFVLEPLCNSQGTELKESGRKFYDDKYKSHFDNLFSTVGDWFKAMGEDPLNKRFGEDWARLTRDLLFDSEGSLKFKPELWSDIRKVILPTLVDQVGLGEVSCSCRELTLMFRCFRSGTSPSPVSNTRMTPSISSSKI